MKNNPYVEYFPGKQARPGTKESISFNSGIPYSPPVGPSVVQDIDIRTDLGGEPADNTWVENFNGNSVVLEALDNMVLKLFVPNSHILGRKPTGDLIAMTMAELITMMELTHHARAYAKIDLSGAATSNIVVLHTTVACTLVKAILLYTEASSADAGVAVTIGKETDDDYYYTGDSETDKALWYEKEVTLLQTDIGAGDTLICGCAGGKTGTGEVLVCVEYRIT